MKRARKKLTTAELKKDLGLLVACFEYEIAAKRMKNSREMRWMIKGLKAYINGEYKTVDEALGLPQGPGLPSLHDLMRSSAERARGGMH